MSTVAAIQTGSKVAATLLRLFSLAWANRPVPPWRYFALGQLVSRYTAGSILKVPSPGQTYNPVWTTGTATAVVEAVIDRDPPGFIGAGVGGGMGGYNSYAASIRMQKDTAARAREGLLISRYAARLLAGTAPTGVMALDTIDDDLDPSHPTDGWLWIHLGMQEWNERFNPKVRAVVGMPLRQFMQPLIDADAAYLLALNAVRLARRRGLTVWPAMIAAEVVTRIESSRVRALVSSQRGQLTVLWRGTPPRSVSSQAGAQKMLEKISGERLAAGGRARVDARWYGPPCPWSMEIAAKSYRVVGPAAVLKYLKVAGDEMRKSLALYAPEGLRDPAVGGVS